MSSAATEEVSHDETATKKGPGLMTLIKAGAFVALIVVLQVVAATMLIPSAAETRAMGEQLVAGEHGEQEHGEHGDKAHDDEHGAEAEHAADHGGGHGDSHGGGHGADTREVNLGSYHVVSYNPKTKTSLSIDFELFGIVLAAEEEEFTHLFEGHEKRLNEQVTIAIRGLEASDFTDPGLDLIKRIILEKTNRVLGKSLVRETVFSGFSFIER